MVDSIKLRKAAPRIEEYQGADKNGDKNVAARKLEWR